jgi:hypothetical protein
MEGGRGRGRGWEGEGEREGEGGGGRGGGINHHPLYRTRVGRQFRKAAALIKSLCLEDDSKIRQNFSYFIPVSFFNVFSDIRENYANTNFISIYRALMRFSREWLEHLAVNAKVATVLGSITSILRHSGI